MSRRDALDSTINYSAHHKFVEKWLTSLNQDSKPSATEPAASEPTPTASATAPSQAGEPISQATPSGVDPTLMVPPMPAPGEMK